MSKFWIQESRFRNRNSEIFMSTAPPIGKSYQFLNIVPQIIRLIWRCLKFYFKPKVLCTELVNKNKGDEKMTDLLNSSQQRSTITSQSSVESVPSSPSLL